MSANTDPVQAQLDAYNRRDLQAFLTCYAPEVRVHGPDGAVLMDGIDAVRERYGRLFAGSPQLQARVVQRIRVRDGARETVIDEEQVSGHGLHGAHRQLQLAVLYEVEGGHIVRVRFLTPAVDRE